MVDPSQGGLQGWRLPVYVLLDCSIMMAGAPVVAVNEGLELVWREMNKAPTLRQIGRISTIRYAETAEQDEFTSVDAFTPPQLRATGAGAVLGAALALLHQSITQDLVAPTAFEGGDYRPVVFLLTAGHATDNWREPARALQALRGAQRPTIVVLGCGAQADLSGLAEITEQIYPMDSITPDVIGDLLVCDTGAAELTPDRNENGIYAQDVPNAPGAKKYVL